MGSYFAKRSFHAHKKGEGVLATLQECESTVWGEAESGTEEALIQFGARTFSI